ncbi:MAG: response regulator [Bdellovibrionaceae bacterium]|nr:response regulator [Pseudobdellovibrionaceae bacterium]
MNIASVDVTLPFNHLNNLIQSSTRTFKSFKKTKKILMIEDDSDMSDILSYTLKMKYNCQIDIAQDPFEAMNMMADKFYDLIILDWQLPGLNGTETLAQTEKLLRLEPSLPIQWDRSKVPVVILSSAKKNECLPRRTKHFDYVGFITKAQPLEMIVDALGELIDNGKTYQYQTA